MAEAMAAAEAVAGDNPGLEEADEAAASATAAAVSKGAPLCELAGELEVDPAKEELLAELVRAPEVLPIAAIDVCELVAELEEDESPCVEVIRLKTLDKSVATSSS